MKLQGFIKKTVTLLTAAVIAVGIMTCLPTGTVVHADEQDELEQKLAENKAQQKKIQEKIDATKKDISKEKEHQDAIEEQMDATEETIRTLVALIAEYDEKIAALEAEIDVLQGDIEIQQIKIANKRAEIDENIVLYEKRLRAMYLSGNDSVASIVLGATDFFDMLMKIELVKRMADYSNDLIDNLIAMHNEYQAAELELENQKAALEETVEITDGKKQEVVDLKNQRDSELNDLQSLYNESKRAIKELQAKESAYKEDKAELDKLADKLDKEIKEVIRKKARKEYMGELPIGDFYWPVPGHYLITSTYGSRWGTTHRGIDISGSGVMGADIIAANSGEVIFVATNCSHNYGKSSSKKYCHCGGGFGNYCIIDHGGGYCTLYGHASTITVKEGQKVKAGQVIGTVGSTGDSTGAHLHFEVRVNEERVNPQKYNLIK